MRKPKTREAVLKRQFRQDLIILKTLYKRYEAIGKPFTDDKKAENAFRTYFHIMDATAKKYRCTYYIIEQCINVTTI